MAQHVLLADDPQAFLSGLVTAARAALPGSLVDSALTVERVRTLPDRLLGREGSITLIRLSTRSHRLELGRDPSPNGSSAPGRSPTRTPRYVTRASRVVRGIVVSRRTLGLAEWLTEFAQRIAELSQDVGADNQPITPGEALRALGISVSGSSIHVGEDTALDDLRALPFKVRGRLPTEASAALERIVTLLSDTLPKATAGSEAQALALRTATVYLPETLQAYLALPAVWAHSHVYADGSTPDGALLAQLEVLEQAATGMHEAAVRGDADVLLVNGRFLTYRFKHPDPDPDDRA
ncbi:hypothetical protein [Subtercola boreus]|uniref:Uncharacterized protein n=1 Tax=Subtercola boreus TaxID=120213 RepID=A0A3E0WCU3_9MICO|nr:hypothetical protein [Subtercola boreus]RFA21175.1 hypothetical protein B7R24_07235 [Subtercola boreus]RFA21558.1 hypothetical protein B7R23_07180 [Subtercola boreus]RFA27528.1 hypothetical protein B7R25_07305 [Subtercola boreus]